MHVGAAGQDADAVVFDVVGHEAFGKDLGAVEGALHAVFEFRGGGDFEGDGLAGDDVHERAALLAGEYGGVEFLGVFLLGEDEAGAWAAEGFVRGGGYDVGVWDGAWMQSGSNVNVCAVKGNFDDAQSAVKRIFGDKELAERLADDSHVVLSSANSINVGRLVPQVVYYFSAYAQLLERQVINVGDEVEFVVPTGNFGDILAGYYAKLLGLPVKHLVVASDKNNVLFDFLTSGTYNRQRPFFQTISPSMDILISSNLERMLYYMSDKDTRLISMLMNDLNQWGAYEVPEPMMKKIRSIFGTGWADENQVREMIADCWNKNHYVIDPHTACGYYVMQQMPRDPLTPRVLLSTASPYKFPRVVNESLGLDASGTDFECMDVLAKATGTTAPAALRGLETADVRFDHVVDIDGMEGFVEQAAKAL